MIEAIYVLGLFAAVLVGVCAATQAAMLANEKPGGHGDRAFAAGAIDMAVWDATAKILGQPLWRLLSERCNGGKFDERVLVYSGGALHFGHAVVLMERFAPCAPAPLVAVGGGIAACTLLGLEARGVGVVGEIPGGLPGLLDLSLARELWPAAAGIAVCSTGHAHPRVVRAIAEFVIFARSPARAAGSKLPEMAAAPPHGSLTDPVQASEPHAEPHGDATNHGRLDAIERNLQANDAIGSHVHSLPVGTRAQQPPNP